MLSLKILLVDTSVVLVVVGFSVVVSVVLVVES